MYFFLRWFYMLFLIVFVSGCAGNNSSVQHKHPLLNKIWSVSQQQFISQQALQQELLAHNLILLGETHDNKQHHRLQADIVKLQVEQQKSPAVAFEMLNQELQSTITQFQQQYYQTHQGSNNITDDFASIVHWEQSGWPDYSYYRPIFKQALENKLPIIAANLDIKLVRKVIKQGPEVLPEKYQNLLKKYPYPAVVQQELELNIQDSHCDMLPEKMLAPMLSGQQVRDIAMMDAIKKALQKNPRLILIAGSGHTRTDYGIPWYLNQELHQQQPELKILSLAFVEVSEDKQKPSDYAQAWGLPMSTYLRHMPFDYVWFTSRAEREDQCEKMKAFMKKKNNN